MTPETDLRIYHDRQGIWVSDGSNVELYKTSASELFAQLRPKSVRLFGMCSQTESILAAIAAKSSLGCDMTVWIGSPAVIGREKEPASILQSMSKLSGLNPYFGGWHCATEADLRTYRVVDAVFRWDTDAAKRLIVEHPAYPALSFLASGRHDDEKTSLVFHVEDPRWFHRDVSHPDRESKLRMFMGLTPRNIDMLAKNSEPNGYNYKKLNILTRLIYGYCPGNVLEQSASSPNQFPVMLTRRLSKTDGSCPALMRAFEFALSFIRQVWLHEIAPPGREVFVPQYFFEPLGEQGEIVAKAYVRHRQELPYQKARLHAT